VPAPAGERPFVVRSHSLVEDSEPLWKLLEVHPVEEVEAFRQEEVQEEVREAVVAASLEDHLAVGSAVVHLHHRA